MNLRSLQTLLLDGDGVLWRDNEAIPGLLPLFDILKRRGINWALLTNNNTKTVGDYVRKLQGFGVEADASHVFTSSTATAEYLADRYGKGAPIHSVGMSGLIDTLREAGFKLTVGEEQPPYPIAAVAAGMDRAITYEKLRIAVRLILNGAEFVATNLDPTFPTPEGLQPGTGLIIGALKGATTIEPTVIGKPGRALYDTAMRHLKADPATTAMLGDRLQTDILGAKHAGIGSIAVLTGVVTREELATTDIVPDLVFESIAELAEALEQAS